MFNFWRAKADSAEEQITPTAESTPPPPPQQEEQPSPAAAEAKVVVVEVIEEAPVAVELVEAPAEPTPAAAPEPEPEAPPKMPHKVKFDDLRVLLLLQCGQHALPAARDGVGLCFGTSVLSVAARCGT